MIAPVYFVWNLHQGSGDNHFVVLERTQPFVLSIAACQIVCDLGVSADGGRAAEDAALAKAKELNAASFAAHVAGRTFDRYQADGFCTVEEDAVPLLSALHGVPEYSVQYELNVQVVHVTHEWIFWSDGVFTLASGANLPPGGALTEDAVRFISFVWQAGDRTVYLNGGLTALTRIGEILLSGKVDGAHIRPGCIRQFERHRVRWVDGKESDLYVLAAGDLFTRFGYEVVVCDDLTAASDLYFGRENKRP